MKQNSISDLLAAIDNIDDPSPFTAEQLPDACIQAASLIARVVDFLEDSGADPVLLGLAIAADQVLDTLIQYQENK